MFCLNFSFVSFSLFYHKSRLIFHFFWTNCVHSGYMICYNNDLFGWMFYYWLIDVFTLFCSTNQYKYKIQSSHLVICQHSIIIFSLFRKWNKWKDFIKWTSHESSWLWHWWHNLLNISEVIATFLVNCFCLWFRSKRCDFWLCVFVNWIHSKRNKLYCCR